MKRNRLDRARKERRREKAAQLGWETPEQRSERKKRERYERQFGRASAVIRTLPCVVKHCKGGPPCQCAHVKSRGAGGGAEHQLPMCFLHHQEQHQVGVQTFAKRYNLDLEAEMARVRAKVEAALGPDLALA